MINAPPATATATTGSGTLTIIWRKSGKNSFKSTTYIFHNGFVHLKSTKCLSICDSHAASNCTKNSCHILSPCRKYPFKLHSTSILNIIIKVVENNVINMHCKMCSKDYICERRMCEPIHNDVCMRFTFACSVSCWALNFLWPKLNSSLYHQFINS